MHKTAAECASMADIRAEIDRLDKQLITLFAERWTYIDRAGEIKKILGLKADIPSRVDEVRMNARRNAQAAGLDPEFYADLWASLIRHSIEHEQVALGEVSKD